MAHVLAPLGNIQSDCITPQVSTDNPLIDYFQLIRAMIYDRAYDKTGGYLSCIRLVNLSHESNMGQLTIFVTLTLLAATKSARTADFQCPTDDDILAYPHLESCKKYYRCTFGQLEELTCPYSLYFDVESRGCTFADSVRCIEGTEVEKWHRPICAKDELVKMVPHQMICDKYYLCLGSNAVERRCDEGFLFDMDTSKCSFPENARCNLDPWCPEYDQLQDIRFFPDPEDCSR